MITPTDTRAHAVSLGPAALGALEAPGELRGEALGLREHLTEDAPHPGPTL